MTLQPWSPTTSSAVAQVVDYQSTAVARLAEWAASADAAYNVATRLVQSSFCPQQFRGKAIEATAAILAGMEVGLQPMAALRSFDVIQGQAAPRALTLRAVAQSYGHEIEVVESTNTRCRVRARRRGADAWQSVTWTIDRAKELGLTSKDNWRKQPGAMLVARATSEAARLVAADAILGIGYSLEELADGATPEQAVAAEVIDAAPTATRRISRRAPEAMPESDPEPELITEAQVKALGAAMHDMSRETALAYCTNVIGRSIESRKDLSKAEASRVLDALHDDETGTLPMEGER